MYKIKETLEFSKLFKKLPKTIQERFLKQLFLLRLDPFSLGKPLSLKFFRELKQEGYRLYYLVYEQDVYVILVGISKKKDQKRMISYIQKQFIDKFK